MFYDILEYHVDELERWVLDYSVHNVLGSRNVPFSLYLLLIQPYHFYAKMPNIMFAKTFFPRYESLILLLYSYLLNMFDW
jgi:hypothetical protein